MKRCLIALLAAAALLAPGSRSATVSDVAVEKDGARYLIVSQLTIDAPRPAVFDILADYDGFERVSSIFEESHFIQRDENGEGLVYTRMRDCLLFFCKTIERVETLELDPPSRIVTVVVPEQSDVRSGETRWILTDNDSGTDIRHEMDMEPDFWVPPVIGPFIIKRYLRKGSERAAERLEKLALEAAAADAG